MSRSSIHRPHAFEKQIIIASLQIGASNSLVPECLGPGIAKSARGLGNVRWFNSYAYPRSVPEPRGRTTPSPSKGNATAKQGCQHCLPIAYNLPLGVCTLTHAFAN
jgi:hypothetical protein